MTPKIKAKIYLLALLLFWPARLFSALLTPTPPMTVEEVERILSQAITRALDICPTATVAVVDREGFVLGTRTLNPNASGADLIYRIQVLDAITKAGTAAFLSSDENAFTSRTAGFIVQQNFPPMVRNKPPGPLVGVNFSNMIYSEVNRFKNPNTYVPTLCGGGGSNGSPIEDMVFNAISGLAGSPGGVPLYRNGRLIGGVGVAGTSRKGRTGISILDDIQMQAQQTYDIDEDIALAGQIGFAPSSIIHGSHVLIDGIRVPYVSSGTRLDTNNLVFYADVGSEVDGFTVTESPFVEYCNTTLRGITGQIRAPIIDDPVGTPILGQPRLSAAEVASILGRAAQRASITRAGIRLPRGKPAQVFISVVNNPAQPGVEPVILGTFRTPDATFFSWDVSVQKARTAVFFSNNQRAFSSRTVGFLAQRFYPPGIVGRSPGPFWGLQEIYSLLPPVDALSSLGIRVLNPLNDFFLRRSYSQNPNVPNGITIFPGGFPLYRNGVLIGAIGISGDGVDQDDIIGASGTVEFLPPLRIRADSLEFRGVRLPYAKFPRNPSL